MNKHNKETIAYGLVIFLIVPNINDNVIMYLSNGGEPSPNGGGSLSSLVQERC